MIPEKWCLKITRDNIDFCKSLENEELGFEKNYNYTIGGFYSSVRANNQKNGPKGSLYLEDRTEITLEQFQEHILKSIKTTETNYNYLIKLFKKLKIT